MIANFSGSWARLVRALWVGARRYSVQKVEARAQELRGRALLLLDRREEAEAALRDALDVAARIEYPAVLWRALSLSGELARRTGDTAEAERRFGRARSLVEEKALTVPSRTCARSSGRSGSGWSRIRSAPIADVSPPPEDAKPGADEFHSPADRIRFTRTRSFARARPDGGALRSRAIAPPSRVPSHSPPSAFVKT